MSKEGVEMTDRAYHTADVWIKDLWKTEKANHKKTPTNLTTTDGNKMRQDSASGGVELNDYPLAVANALIRALPALAIHSKSGP